MSYSIIKFPLDKIIKYPKTIQTINQAVLMVHQMTIHTLQFIKLYLLHCYEQKLDLPIIDKIFILNCLKIQCTKETKAGRKANQKTKELIDQLTQFHQNHYLALIPPDEQKLTYENLGQILRYQTASILTDYENSIKFHFIDYLNHYINITWKQESRETLRKVKKDLLNGTFKSDSKFHKWIGEHRTIFFSHINKSIAYDLKAYPLNFVPSLIYMNQQIENIEGKLFNCIPLRTDLIPKHIRIDTTSVVELLFDQKLNKVMNNKIKYKRSICKNKDRIWKFLFRTERKYFRSNKYQFDYQIETD